MRGLGIAILIGTIVVLAGSSGWPAPAAGAPPSAVEARRVFDRLRGLAGDWRGRSTKGWEDRMTLQVIAGGSVVMSTSQFEAHPDETMLTTYHLDGDRMMLTHYCVAKNQPRLQVTSIEDQGNRVIFSFRDGTNLPSRDKGHMDQVIYQFQDEDHFTSQWSFFSNGKEDWMEEIHYERIR